MARPTENSFLLPTRSDDRSRYLLCDVAVVVVDSSLLLDSRLDIQTALDCRYYWMILKEGQQSFQLAKGSAVGPIGIPFWTSRLVGRWCFAWIVVCFSLSISHCQGMKRTQQPSKSSCSNSRLPRTNRRECRPSKLLPLLRHGTALPKPLLLEQHVTKRKKRTQEIHLLWRLGEITNALGGLAIMVITGKAIDYR
jgi:hypothetical protein